MHSPAQAPPSAGPRGGLCPELFAQLEEGAAPEAREAAGCDGPPGWALPCNPLARVPLVRGGRGSARSSAASQSSSGGGGRWRVAARDRQVGRRRERQQQEPAGQARARGQGRGRRQARLLPPLRGAAGLPSLPAGSSCFPAQWQRAAGRGGRARARSGLLSPRGGARAAPPPAPPWGARSRAARERRGKAPGFAAGEVLASGDGGCSRVETTRGTGWHVLRAACRRTWPASSHRQRLRASGLGSWFPRWVMPVWVLLNAHTHCIHTLHPRTPGYITHTHTLHL